MSNEPLRVSNNNNDMHQNFTVEGPGLQVLEKYINRFYKSPNTHTHTHTYASYAHTIVGLNVQW